MELSTLCPNCKNEYSQDNPPKCLIKCQHRLCLKCLKQLIICPIDKVRIQFRRFPFEAFKTDEELLQLCHGPPSPQKTSSESKKTSKKNTPKASQPSRSLKSKSSKKEVCEPPKEQQVLVADFQEQEVGQQGGLLQQSNVTEESCNKSPLLEKKQSFSPKKQIINYQTCLLHSKRADLICVQDKCVICSGCGLFGEHKHHTIIPYDTFLTQYSTLTEQCFKNYEQLQGQSQKLSHDLLQQKINSLLTEKRSSQLKNIKAFIKQLSDMLKVVEKDLTTTLDACVSYKKGKIMQFLNFQELSNKRNNYMLGVENMTEGLECLFNMENVEKYIPFIDPNHEKSYIQQEGEYLIRQIDNYNKTLQLKIDQEISEFTIAYKIPELSLFKGLSSIESKDSKGISELADKSKKEGLERSNRVNTPSRSSLCKNTTVLLGKSAQRKESPVKTQQQAEDNLLLELNSKSVSPEKKKEEKNLSPIHPLSSFQNFEMTSYNSTGPQFFLKVSAEPPLPETNQNRRKSKTSSMKPILPHPRLSKTKILQNMENNNQGQTSRLRSKPKSNNNSNNMTQRQLLNVLNERSDNKRRRKIELPQKYSKIYEELQKEKLEVVDFGGAFLGDQTVLAISECFQQPRGRIKQVKLMNNKLSDESFPDLVNRCRNVPSLNLSYNGFTQRCLEWLLMQASNLGDLRNITLSNCKIVLRSNKDKVEQLKRRGINVSL